MLLLPFLACRGPSDDDDTTTGPHTGDTATTQVGTTGDTATNGTTPVVDPDCLEEPPSGPFTATSTSLIRTEEDFDFDILGFLITQMNTNLGGVTRAGLETIVAAGIGSDAAGIRSLPDANILIAQPDTGAVRRVDYDTGGSAIVLSGLTFPNGLEVGLDGMAYVSEYNSGGGVRMFDPYTGQFDVIVNLSNPNGMTLSPDELTLYIATSSSPFSGTGRIVAIERASTDDAWDSSPRTVYDGASALGGLTSDKCGNLYATEYSSGRVLRILMPEGDVEPIADLSGSGSFSSARFSPGYGDWSRTELYVTNRSELFVIEVEIEGRHVLAD